MQYDTSVDVSIDDDIERITASIAAASQAGQWPTVRDLTKSLQDLMVEKRKHQTPMHRMNLSRSVAGNYAEAASENYAPNAEFLRAVVERYGSLRHYAELRGVPASSLSAYATGRLPCPHRIAAMVKRDFSRLKWEWPAGLEGQDPTRRKRGRPRKIKVDD